MQVWLILRYLNILIANGCSLARQCCQVVPNLLRMFQLFTSNLQLVGQQWWPGHCPSPGGFQRVLPLMPERALSATSPNRNTSIFLLWPFTAAFVIRFHANWAENPSVETTNYSPGNPHTRLFFHQEDFLYRRRPHANLWSQSCYNTVPGNRGFLLMSTCMCDDQDRFSVVVIPKCRAGVVISS